MEKILPLKRAFGIVLLAWLAGQAAWGQVRVYSTMGGIPAGAGFPSAPAVTERKIVYAYEGFDYYSATSRQVGQFGQIPSSVDAPSSYARRATLAAIPNPTEIQLHNPNVGKLNNSEFALGWAGDWKASNTVSTTYTVSNTVSGTTINSPRPNELFSLVNAGYYAKGGGGISSIGRRLQTSTAGYFYEYEIWQDATQNNAAPDGGTPANAFWFSGGVGSGLNIDERYSVTLPQSTIRTLSSATVAHHRVSEPVDANPATYDGRTHTMNTSIGAHGSTVWFGFLMRINGATNENAFVQLHTDADPSRFDLTGSKLAVGFSATAGKWALSSGGTAYTSSDTVQFKRNQFTLLVVRIDFNPTNTVSMYVLNNNSALYNDFTSDGIIDAPATPYVTISQAADLSFHSVSYYGGPTANYSNIDELRFARTYEMAALSSKVISVVSDLCETPVTVPNPPGADITVAGGQVGLEANTGGSLGSIQTIDVATPLGGEFVGTASTYNGVYEPLATRTTAPLTGAEYTTDAEFNTVNDNTKATARVMFEASGTSFAGATYGSLAPGFVYNANNNGQPNDGNYYVGNQSRSPFGTFSWSKDLNGDNDTNDPGETVNLPVWIRIYDNSGDRRGNLMVVNAAYSRGAFFTQTVSGICDGTQYEFYADIINLFPAERTSISNLPSHGNGTLSNYECEYDFSLEPGASQFAFAGTDQRGASGLGAATRGQPGINDRTDCGALNPEIEFLIDGVPVYIPPATIPNDEKWHRIGFTFITKNVAGGNVTIEVRNRAPGGNGNDLAMDNFSFRPCGPKLQLQDNSLCMDPTERTVKYRPIGKTYRKPYYRWVIIPPECQSNCNDSDPTKRVYCVANCGSDLTTDADNPANAEYEMDMDLNNWLTVGGQAFLDAGEAELGIDTLHRNTPNFFTRFPGGFIPKGTRIFAFSASESTANTLSEKCRIDGEPAMVSCNFLALPVMLLEFTARPENGNVRLDWKTVKEEAFKEYVVERSADGVRFEPVGTVRAKGATGIATYLFHDQAPLDGISYYRLLLADANGSSKYSEVETVRMDAAYAVYPVPASDRLMVAVTEANNKTRNITVSITNTLGKLVYQNGFGLSSGQESVEIPVSALSPGVYVIEIRDKAVTFKKRIVISR